MAVSYQKALLNECNRTRLRDNEVVKAKRNGWLDQRVDASQRICTKSAEVSGDVMSWKEDCRTLTPDTEQSVALSHHSFKVHIAFRVVHFCLVVGSTCDIRFPISGDMNCGTLLVGCWLICFGEFGGKNFQISFGEFLENGNKSLFHERLLMF